MSKKVKQTALVIAFFICVMLLGGAMDGWMMDGQTTDDGTVIHGSLATVLITAAVLFTGLIIVVIYQRKHNLKVE